MDYSIDPEFLLVGQGTVCEIANASFFTWFNALGHMDKSFQKCKEKSTWLFKVHYDFLWELFS